MLHHTETKDFYKTVNFIQKFLQKNLSYDFLYGLHKYVKINLKQINEELIFDDNDFDYLIEMEKFKGLKVS